MRMKAGNGIAATEHFVLSKDRLVDVAVISVLDIAMLAAAAFLIGLTLLAIGRHHWGNRIVRRFRRQLRGDHPPVSDAREKVLT